MWRKLIWKNQAKKGILSMKSLPELAEVPCNLCSAKEEEIIFKTDRGNIVKCKKCGLFYRTPRLSDRDEIHRYQKLVHKDSFCEIQDRTKKKLFLSTLKKLEPHKGRILDIGCANGYFLALARERGWEPHGTEVSESFLRKARENLGEKSVSGCPLRMAEFPSDFFDAVTLWDVLDHLLDPLGELREIKRILKKKGILLIRVRNMTFHLLVNRLIKKNFLGIIKKPAIFHLYGFNRKNIKVLLEKADFFEIKVSNSMLTAGDPYSQIRLLGASNISFMKKTYYAFSELLSFLSSKRILISPSLVIYAEKE
jgi:SAM-dependent methyltransferase